MRASRLLTILMLLQARGRVTAPEMAAECEVSLRTIYRDIDALSAAGVPVYADRGNAGGYRLLDGWRTRLNGLSAQEAEALFMSGLAGPAAALGLGATMDAAQLKLTAALPAGMRGAAGRMRARFHLDAPGWFQAVEEPPFLRAIAAAVWEQRYCDIRYRSWQKEAWRRVAPLGIVLKGGAWYSVARVNGPPRTYRVARVLDFVALDETFERPADFDLATYWNENIARLEADMHPRLATVRFSRMGVMLMEALTPVYVRANMVVVEEHEDGGRTVSMPVAPTRVACSDLLRFGMEVEVLAPVELREAMRGVVDRLVARYSAV
jgi:predicted DNA-binding transcriptional regulator YafY